MLVLYIAVGGALGAVARWALGGWIVRSAGAAFPWSTLVVNVLGSLLIGFGLAYMDAADLPAHVRAFVSVGLLGAFTTFSTFSYDAVALLEKGQWATALVYAMGSVILGVLAVLAGLHVAAGVIRPAG